MSDAATLLDSLSGEDSWSRHRALERLRAEGAAPDVIEGLREALDDPASDRRAAARMALAALASPESAAEDRALAVLRAELEGGEPGRRVLSASALGESGNPAAGEPLVDALRDPDLNVAAAAADALGELGYGPALEPLVALTRSEVFWLRAAAVVALGRLRDERAVPALARIAEEGDGLDAAITEALERIGHPAGLDGLERLAERIPLEASLAAGSILCAHPDEEAPGWLVRRAGELVEPVRRRLGDEECAEAGRLLGLAGTPEAARTLLDAVGPPRWSDAAIAGLSALPAGTRAALLPQRLPEADAREAAILLSLLPPLSEDQAIASVVPYLTHDDESVRAAAAEALARAPVARALPVLIDRLTHPPAAPAVIQALGGLGSAACGALAPMLADPAPAVRRAAAAALARCGDSSVAGQVETALASETDGPTRRALTRTLARLAGARALPVLDDALRSEDAEDRLSAIEALGLTGSEDAVPRLDALLSDAADVEALVAIRALGHVESERAVQALLPRAGSPDPELRRAVARALAALPVAGQEPTLLSLSRDPDVWVRLFAARSLRRLRSNAGRDRLVEMAEVDPAPEVRSEARRALRDP